METLKFKKLSQDSKSPLRAREEDIGTDLIASEEPTIVGHQYPSPYHFKNAEPLYTSIDYLEYKTGIAVELPRFRPPTPIASSLVKSNYHLFVFPRSSLSKFNLVLCNSVGVIDDGYRGEILLRFKYIPQEEDRVFLQDYVSFLSKTELTDGSSQVNFSSFIRINPERIMHKGDKIGQLVLANVSTDYELLEVKELTSSERGDKGFGSSGR